MDIDAIAKIIPGLVDHKKHVEAILAGALTGAHAGSLPSASLDGSGIEPLTEDRVREIIKDVLKEVEGVGGVGALFNDLSDRLDQLNLKISELATENDKTDIRQAIEGQLQDVSHAITDFGSRLGAVEGKVDAVMTDLDIQHPDLGGEQGQGGTEQSQGDQPAPASEPDASKTAEDKS